MRRSPQLRGTDLVRLNLTYEADMRDRIQRLQLVFGRRSVTDLIEQFAAKGSHHD
jgi:hypothetical protein